MPNLDDILLKEVDELNDEEKKTLNENWDTLSDDDKEVFNEVHTTPDPPAEDKHEDKTFTFKDEEDFNRRVEEKTKQIKEDLLKELKPPEDKDTNKEDELPNIFPDDYKPKDWNEVAKIIIGKSREETLAYMGKMTQKQKDRIDEINKEYDVQIENIRANNKDIPAKGTKDGDKFERDLAEIGTKFRGVMNMNDAYDIYQATHDKAIPESQKNLAGKVGKGGGQPGGDKTLKYARLNKPLDELIDEEMEKLS